MKNTIKDCLEYYSLKTAISFFKLLPYGITVRLMAYLTWFGGKVLRIRRKLVVKQLKAVFPEKMKSEINKLTNKIYFELGISACEMFIAEDERIFRNSITYGLEDLQECLAKKKGILFVSAHFGNWEMGAKYLAKQSGKIYAVVKKQRNRLFDEYVNNSRIKSNVYVLDMRTAIRPIMNILSDNGAVGFLVDQYARKYGADLPFLGIPTKVYTSVAKLSLKFKTPIVIAFDVREGFYKHHLHICKPIYTDDIPLTEENILDLTQKISYHIEDYIKKFPELWFWVHRRWRNL